MSKEFIQCGYENNCKRKDCLKCTRRIRMSISLTLAEQIVIEDFAVCDLKLIQSRTPKQIDLMQKIMFNVMKKVFKEQKK